MERYSLKAVYCCCLELLLLLLVSHSGKADEDQPGYYIVAASGTIFSGRPYGVVVSVFDTDEGCSCEVQLKGPSLNMSIDLHMTPFYPSSSYRFQIPELRKGLYTLTVRSVWGMKFENSTNLIMQDIRNFIKIQTPKLNYQVGELLQFRVLFHNESMHAVYPTSSSMVWIEDSRKYRVKLFNNVDVVRGVFQGRLRLGRFPNLGAWRICAKNGPQSMEECEFIQVSETKMSLFQVSIQVPVEISRTVEELPIKVKANYITNQTVVGNLTLDMRTYADSGEIITLMHKQENITNGEYNLNVIMSDFISKIPLRGTRIIRVVIIVEEQKSGKVVTAYKDVSYNPDPNATFRAPPGPNKSIPIRLKKNLITIDYGQTTGDPVIVELKPQHNFTSGICVVMFNGLVLTDKQVFSNENYTFSIPVQLTQNMWPYVHVFLYAKIQNRSELFVTVETIKARNREHEHMEVKVPTEIQPGEEISMRIKPLPKSFFGFLAVDTSVLTTSDISSQDFSELYFDMIKSKLSYVAAENLENKMKTAFDMGLITLTNAPTLTELKPNKMVLKKYFKMVPLEVPIANEVDKEILPTDVNETMTDTEDLEKIPLQKTTIIPKSRGRHLFHTIISPRSPFSRIKKRIMRPIISCCDEPPSGQESSNIWIFNSSSVDLEKPGWLTWKMIVPKEITTWRLTGFSVDGITGLTLMGQPPYFTDIKCTNPIYLKSDTPYSIKVGEILILPVECFNELEETITVTIRAKKESNNFHLLNHSSDLRKHSMINSDLEIPKGSSKSTLIHLRATRSGTLTLNITAKYHSYEYELAQQIEVLQSGPLISHQLVMFEILRGDFNEEKNFHLRLPHHPNSDGVKCQLSADMIAANMQSHQPIQKIDNAEQLLTKMLAIYYLMDYMQDQNSLSNNWRQYFKRQLVDGFQATLRMRKRTGSYSYLDNDRNGCASTWLTAYTLSMFQNLEKFPFHFDPRLREKTENYLLKQRRNHTKFTDNCITIERRYLSQLELSMEVMNGLQLSKRMMKIQKSVEWMSEEIRSTDEYYIQAKRGINLVSWIPPKEQTNGNWSAYRRDLEASARILALQIKRNKIPTVELYQWLVKQLYSENCATDSYECSVARRALYDYMKQPGNEAPAHMDISIWSGKGREQSLNLNDSNKQKTQEIRLKVKNQLVNIKVFGVGELLVRCSYNYNPNDQAVKKASPTTTKFRYQLQIQNMNFRSMEATQIFLKFCVLRSENDREYYIGTNIVLDVPSGYVIIPKSVKRIMSYKLVQQSSLENGNTRLRLNFAQLLYGKFVCLSVLSSHEFTVKNLQNGTLSAYDRNSLLKPDVISFNMTNTVP